MKKNRMLNKILIIITLILITLSIIGIGLVLFSNFKEKSVGEKIKFISLYLILIASIISIFIFTRLFNDRGTISDIRTELEEADSENELVRQSIVDAESSIRAGRESIDDSRGTLEELRQSIRENEEILRRIGEQKTQ